MKPSKLPSKYRFVTFSDPDPSGDGSTPAITETVFVETPMDIRHLPPVSLLGDLAEKFEAYARENEEWDCLTTLVEGFMDSTGLKWGWACSSGPAIEIPF